MIVLDTNVISELLSGSRADPLVLTWVRSLRDQPVTTALNRAELLAGAAALPHGRRRTELIEGISRLLGGLHITLPFSTDCAGAYAELRETRRRAGRPISTMDALIASIALVHDAAIATRDAAGFTGLGLEVVDPWARRGR